MGDVHCGHAQVLVLMPQGLERKSGWRAHADHHDACAEVKWCASVTHGISCIHSSPTQRMLAQARCGSSQEPVTGHVSCHVPCLSHVHGVCSRPRGPEAHPAGMPTPLFDGAAHTIGHIMQD